MSEPVIPATAAVVESTDLDTAAPEIKRSDFIPVIVIKDKGNHKFEIAASAIANRAQGQVIVSKVRTLFEKCLDEYIQAKESPSAAIMKAIADAAATIQDMSVTAYEGRGLKGSDGTDLERLAVGMVRAATEGAAAGASDKFKDRLERIKQLGRHPVKRVEPVVQEGVLVP